MLAHCERDVICCRHGIACEDAAPASSRSRKTSGSSACYSTTTADTTYQSCNADLSLIDASTKPRKVVSREQSLCHVLNQINHPSISVSSSRSVKLVPAHSHGHRHGHKHRRRHRHSETTAETPSDASETNQFDNMVSRSRSSVYSTSDSSTEYENVSSSASSASLKKLPPVATNTKAQRNFQRRITLQRRFIGCLTAEQAENRTVGLSTFFAYYALPKSNYELTEELEHSRDRNFLPFLQLKIVYLSASGHYFHFPIKAVEFKDGTTMYQVQYGDENALKFRTVERLIDYYSNYTAIRVSSGRGISAIDVFPVWKLTTKDGSKKGKKPNRR
uniref:SH2 domain-containing protein n=1 Tax=Panagrellus redivivus TaxID=6233 RepID=A0A7E4VY90_PANRE